MKVEGRFRMLGLMAWLGFVTRWGEKMTGFVVVFVGVVEDEAPGLLGEDIRCW